MIVLDTHALLWWALDPDKLSATARTICERMERDGAFASSISIWELGIKVKSGKLDLGLPLEEFVRRLEATSAVELLPVTTSIWVKSLALEWNHRDPADRVIVATAQEKALPILSKDATLQSFAAAKCVW